MNLWYCNESTHIKTFFSWLAIIQNGHKNCWEDWSLIKPLQTKRPGQNIFSKWIPIWQRRKTNIEENNGPKNFVFEKYYIYQSSKILKGHCFIYLVTFKISLISIWNLWGAYNKMKELKKHRGSQLDHQVGSPSVVNQRFQFLEHKWVSFHVLIKTLQKTAKYWHLCVKYCHFSAIA